MLGKKMRQTILSAVIAGSLFIGNIANAWDIAYPANDVYSIQPKLVPNAELSTRGQGKSNGINVMLQPYSDRNVKWRLTKVNNEWYKITVEGTNNIGLNVDNGRNVNGTNLTLWEAKGDWQLFRFWDIGGGYYLIQGKVGGREAMVLDVANGNKSPDANVWVWGHNNTDSQLWKLVKWTGNNTNISRQAHNPMGYFDGVTSNSAGNITLVGWAFDKDNLNAQLEIHVYVGGGAGSGAPGYRIAANKSRPDVNKAYPGVGNNHGFNDTIQVNKTGNQEIYVYAINVGGGENQFLGSKVVNIKSDQPAEKAGYINTQSKNLNLRSSPNGAIIGKLAKNTPVTILQGNSNGWTKVRTDSGQEGYVSSQYVAIGEPPKPDNRLDAAMNYIASLEGRAMDYDHYAGAQCVDLIKYYYDYLGVANYARGNGKDYATNSLPPGWQRIRGAVPQRGDILVYTSGGGGYGHVAIAESTDISWHQNYNGKYVRKITGNYKNIHVGYWGVIRPAF